MNDKEKLEAIYEIINKKAEEMDDPPVSRGTKSNHLLGGIKESEYKKILKETVEIFFGEMDMLDYGLEERSKKEITEHFDKLFKSPEFERMMDKALDEDDD